jgi:hypothetical protein
MIKYAEFLFSGLSFVLFAQVERNRQKLKTIAAAPIPSLDNAPAAAALDVAYSAKNAVDAIGRKYGQKTD